MNKELEKTKRKTALEHFQDIKELEVADGPNITVEDILPYKCEQVEQSLIKAQEQEKVLNEALKLNGKWAEELDDKNEILRIIKAKDVDMYSLRRCQKIETYNANYIVDEYQELTEEEFNLLKELIKDE